MKTDQTNYITLFALAYLITFTCLYVFLFFDIRGFLIVLLSLSFISLPSLLGTLILYFMNLKKKFIENRLVYIFSSVFLFIPSFLIWNKLTYDPRNIFPIFEESEYLIFVLCIVSHIAPFICMELITKIKTV